MNILGWKLPKQVVSEKAWYEHEDVLDETCKYLVGYQHDWFFLLLMLLG